VGAARDEADLRGFPWASGEHREKKSLGLIPRADRGRGALRPDPDSPPAGGEDPQRTDLW
jgi:hypothetical protein